MIVVYEISDASSTQIQLKPELLRVGQTEAVFCVSANSPRQFWCQLESKGAEIEQLMSDMNAHYNALAAGDATVRCPAVGTVCCAQFSEDGQWYRARVDRLVDAEVEVLFVDFGNSEKMAATKIQVSIIYLTGIRY